jgi:hypothetical protein
MRRELYRAAKFDGHHDAAATLIKTLVSTRVLDTLIDDLTPNMQRGTPIICVVPHPPFDDLGAAGADLIGRADVKNAIPIQYMAYLSAILDAEMDTEIIQRGRVGRTKLTRIERFLWQPCFAGEVRPEAAYILVDDVMTTGGTLAALRSHIISNKGTVAGITTLAHGSGDWRQLALSQETWHEIEELFGPELSSFWESEIGHDARCFTETEGRTLVSWARGRGTGNPLLQQLRNELIATAAQGDHRESVSGS